MAMKKLDKRENYILTLLLWYEMIQDKQTDYHYT